MLCVCAGTTTATTECAPQVDQDVNLNGHTWGKRWRGSREERREHPFPFPRSVTCHVSCVRISSLVCPRWVRRTCCVAISVEERVEWTPFCSVAEWSMSCDGRCGVMCLSLWLSVLTPLVCCPWLTPLGMLCYALIFSAQDLAQDLPQDAVALELVLDRVREHDTSVSNEQARTILVSRVAMSCHVM